MILRVCGPFIPKSQSSEAYKDAAAAKLPGCSHTPDDVLSMAWNGSPTSRRPHEDIQLTILQAKHISHWPSGPSTTRTNGLTCILAQGHVP